MGNPNRARTASSESVSKGGTDSIVAPARLAAGNVSSAESVD